MKNLKNIIIIAFLTTISIFFSYRVFISGGDYFNSYWLYKSNINKTNGEIVIIKIDTKTIEKLQESDLSYLNFSKGTYQKTIKKLLELNARVIGFDIVFANQNSDYEDFSKIIKENQDKIVLSAKFGPKGGEKVLPLENFPKEIIGSIDSVSKSGFTLKYIPYLQKENAEAFSVLIYKKYVGEKNIGKIQNGYYQINPIKKIPLDKENEAYINFFNSPGEYKNFSLIDLIDGKIDKKEIEGKIVLIGEVGSLIHDAYLSPIDLSKKMSGVEFHANIIESIMNNKFLQEQNDLAFYLTNLILLILFVVFFYFFPAIISLFVMIAYVLIILIIGRYLLLFEGILINLYVYNLVGFFSFFITFSYKYITTNKEKIKMEDAFSKYISLDLVKKISLGDNKIILGGEKKKLAILFSDIEGFTTISEKLETEKLFAFLSKYLFEMTDILMKNNGTLDKYIGDAIMGFYGAPVYIEKPVFFACKTAIEMQRKLKVLNLEWKKIGISEIKIRIGIDYGEVMVGNIGSNLRFNYTVIGDNVNIASRLESVNKEYGTNICISENVYNEVKNEFLFREIDNIKVKGKSNPTKIYEIIGIKGEDVNLGIYKKYEEGLELYYKGELENAKKIFEKNIGDDLSRIMAKRCRNMIDGKLEIKNGIFEMENK